MLELMLTFLLVLGVGFWAGMKFSNWVLTRVFRDLLTELGVSDQRLQSLARDYGAVFKEDTAADTVSEEPQTIELKLEQHGDQIYAFRKSDDQFLGQGQDYATLTARLEQDVVNRVRYLVHDEDGAELIKSQTKEAK